MLNVKVEVDSLPLFIKTHWNCRTEVSLTVDFLNMQTLKLKSQLTFAIFAAVSLACEQALRGLWWQGGKRKESLQLRLWNLNICIKKVYVKCWLAEMTLVMMSLPKALVFQCLFTFVLVSTSRWLAESEWEPQGNWQTRRSCKLSFLFPPSPQSAPDSLLTGYCQSS